MMVKTSELTGAALDWAVAIAQGYEPDRPQDGQVRRGNDYRLVGPDANHLFRYSPSTNWAHGGPLVDKFKPIFTFCNGLIRSEILGGVGVGEAYLIALCRAVVAKKLGDSVDIPAELLEGV